MDQFILFYKNWYIYQIIISIISICVFCLWLKYTLEKNKYFKLIASANVDFKSIAIYFLKPPSHQNLRNGFPFAVYLLQYIVNFFHLFPKTQALFCVWMTYTPFIFLNTPEAIEEVMSGTKFLEKAWFYDWLHCWLGTGLLTSYGKKWKSRRKLLTPAFHFDILKDFLPTIDEKSRQLVKKLKEETSQNFTNIRPPITLCSLDVICETTLGVNINAQENSESEYVKAVARVTDLLTNRAICVWSWFDFVFLLTAGRKLKKDLNLLHTFTMSAIQEKKKQLLSKVPESTKHKRKALMELLLEHHIKFQDLTEEDIREEVDTFTFEGHDTTSAAMTWALYLIGLYKDAQAHIHTELDAIFGDDLERAITNDDLNNMKYLECVVKESLRLYPSVPVIARKTDKEVIICGYPIPKGASLVVIPYQLHRNEDVFPNPEVFEPNRFTAENSTTRHPYAYLPFSAGPRNCIGQRFALMEEKIIIANILRNYRLESLDPRDRVSPTIEIILQPYCPIRIKIRPRRRNE